MAQRVLIICFCSWLFSFFKKSYFESQSSLIDTFLTEDSLVNDTSSNFRFLAATFFFSASVTVWSVTVVSFIRWKSRSRNFRFVAFSGDFELSTLLSSWSLSSLSLLLMLSFKLWADFRDVRLLTELTFGVRSKETEDDEEGGLICDFDDDLRLDNENLALDSVDGDFLDDFSVFK